jgi:hypothetical protein
MAPQALTAVEQSAAGVGASDFHFIIAIQGLENCQYGLCFAAGQVHYDA